MDDPRQPPRREARTRGALLLALCLAALAAKSPDAWTNPQPWAEDGRVFFAEQQGRPLPLVATPHAGYLVVGQRLAAWPTVALPLALVPRWLCLAAWLLAGVSCASFLWRLRGARLDLIAFAALFLSPTSGEVFGNLASAQWFVQLHLLAACFAPRPAGSALLVLLAALTGPFSVLLSALYCALLALAWPIRSARETLLRPWTGSGRWRLTALGAGALVQGACLVASGGEGATRLTLPLLVTALGEWSQVHVLHRQLLPGWAFLLLLAGLLAGALRATRRGPEARLFLVLLAGQAALEVVLAAGRPGIYLGSLEAGDRYFVLLRVALWVTAGALVDGLLPRGASRLGAAAALTCLILGTALTPTTNLRRPPLVPDLGWAERVAAIPPGERARVPIHPAGWSVVVEGR